MALDRQYEVVTPAGYPPSPPQLSMDASAMEMMQRNSHSGLQYSPYLSATMGGLSPTNIHPVHSSMGYSVPWCLPGSNNTPLAYNPVFANNHQPDIEQFLTMVRPTCGDLPCYSPYGNILPYPQLTSYGSMMERRKSSVKELSSTLKTWMNEHRQNPYPSKAEKIMLALVCRMTLTQVSTWFANARRRLKETKKGLRAAEDGDGTDGEEGMEEGPGGSSDDDCSSYPSPPSAGDNISSDVTSHLGSRTNDTCTGGNEVKNCQSSALPNDTTLPHDISSRDHESSRDLSPSTKSSREPECASKLAPSKNSTHILNNKPTEHSPIKQNLIPAAIKPKIWSIDDIVGQQDHRNTEISNTDRTVNAEIRRTDGISLARQKHPFYSTENGGYSLYRVNKFA